MTLHDTSITLSKVRFHAYHGLLPHEQKVGNDFEITLTVHFDATLAMQSGAIQYTINYATLFELLTEEMQIPTPLLEEVCYRILRSIGTRFPSITSATITLSKLMPPISRFEGEAVRFTASATY